MNLAQMLRKSREQNKVLAEEIKHLNLRNVEAQGDIKVMTCDFHLSYATTFSAY